MTLPIERTRALRMAWEFLWDLHSAGNLSAELQRFVGRALEQYPTPAEIDEWARTGPLGFSQSPLDERWLAPEPADSVLPSVPSAAPAKLDRSPVTSKERMRSVFAASALLHGHLRGVMQLSDEQRRKRAVVARHFPIGVELVAMATREGVELPNSVSEEDFLRRGKAAIQRTITMNDGRPADAVIAKLESKLAQARKTPRP